MALTKTLDRSRAHGSVHPPEKGQHFEQDGYPFDHEGKLCEHLLSPAQKAKLAAKKPAPAQNPPNPTNQKPAGDEGGEGGEQDEQNGGGAPDEVNLEAWLRTGLDSEPFRVVQNAVKSRHHKWCTAKGDLVTFLVTEIKLVPEAELAADIAALVVK